MDLIWIILFLFALSASILIYNWYNNTVYVRSTIDNEYYLVRKYPDKQLASNMLAQIKQNIYKLCNYLYAHRESKYKKYKSNIIALTTNIQNAVIEESNEHSLYTSYTIDKGKNLVFCLRSKTTKQIYDLNLLMYVVLHEISHIACPDFGHSKLFIDIFAFMVKVAMDIGLYKKIDFDNQPSEYCGLVIRNSVI